MAKRGCLFWCSGLVVGWEKGIDVTQRESNGWEVGGGETRSSGFGLGGLHCMGPWSDRHGQRRLRFVPWLASLPFQKQEGPRLRKGMGPRRGIFDLEYVGSDLSVGAMGDQWHPQIGQSMASLLGLQVDALSGQQ